MKTDSVLIAGIKESKRDWTGIDPVAGPFFREGCLIVTQGGVSADS